MARGEGLVFLGISGEFFMGRFSMNDNMEQDLLKLTQFRVEILNLKIRFN